MPHLPASAETKSTDGALAVQTLEDFHAAAESVARKPITDADEAYRARLEKHQKTAQAAGNLKSLQAARQAIKDLDAGQPPVISPDPEVAGIQKPYIDLRQKAVAESETALAKAEKDHLASLKKLVVDLTKAGQFDQAQEVQAKVDGLAAVLSPTTAVAGGEDLETWKRKAQTEFPALNDPASPLSQRLKALMTEKKSIPGYFKNPQWPYLVAKEAEQTSPPAGARFFNGKWYFVYEEKCSWTNARDKCNNRGGQLAIVLDQETQVFVTQLASGKMLWLGATDEKKEGQWEWVNGTEMNFKNFSPGKPNNYPHEYYLALNFRRADGNWDDFPARRGDILGYICEWPNLASPLEASKTNPAPVPSTAPAKPHGIVTGRANQLSQAQGGKSKVMADMEFILSKYGTAENDVAAHPDVNIYEGPSPGRTGENCRITYLMPRGKAEELLLKNRGIVTRNTAVAPGFPPGMVIHTYDIRFGDYNRLYLMVDLADQVVTLTLKAESANIFPSGREWVKIERDFSTFDYVNTEARGTPRLIIDTHVMRKNSYIVVNMVAGMIKETTTWYVPNPLIKQILFHLEEDKRKSGKK